jgi:tRNA-2-methylthio-N6-dimethylallyladenosine synthase
VQEGCDKFCTFCVVPYTRGAKSRGRSEDPRRGRNLADAGVREVTLIGRTSTPITAKGAAGAWTLGRLLHRVAEIPASRGCATPPAIRATWTTTLIAAHRDLPQLAPQLHLPVQSGSDASRAMNRRHTRADYLARSSGCAPRGPISRSRRISSSASRARPKSDFRDTLRSSTRSVFGRVLVQVFAAPGTPAPTWTDQVAEEVKSERLARLQAAINRHAAASMRAASAHLRRADGKAGRDAGQYRSLAISAAGAGDGAGT